MVLPPGPTLSLSRPIFWSTFFLVVVITISGGHAFDCDSSSSYTIGSSTSLRRDWAGLSTNDKNQFAQAYVSLYNASESKPSIVRFNCYFSKATEQSLTPVEYILFLKVLLSEIESELRVKSGISTLSIPYGNWEPNFNNPTSYETSTVGGGGDGCVDFSGTPFSNFPKCITRRYRTPTQLINEADYRNALSSPSPQIFSFLLTWGIQGTIYFNYGGDISVTSTAVLDPIFLLQTSNIIRLFDDWQRRTKAAYPSELPGNVRFYNNVAAQSVFSASSSLTYENPVYNPSSAVESSAAEIFGQAFGSGQQNFWDSVGRKRQNRPCNVSVYAEKLLDLTATPQQILLNLLSSPDSYQLRKFLQSVLQETNGNETNGNETQSDQLLVSVVDRLSYGVAFNWTIHWANVLEEFQRQCQGLYYFGGKFPSNPGYFMSQVMAKARKDRVFQEFTKKACSLARRVNLSNQSNPQILPLQSELSSLGVDIVRTFAAVVTPVTPLSRVTGEIPIQWRCPDAWYNSNDGCDCRCGAADPDCTTDSSSAFQPNIPLFGCFGGPSAICVRGICVYRNSTVPAGWSCDPKSYNSSDGCDCGCGVRDPDCDKFYSWNYRLTSPNLYGVKGCTAGRGAGCSPTGQCIYSTPVPPRWRCPIEKYADGESCDCNCGALDPDCAAPGLPIEGCGCPQLTCANQFGFCEGSCPDVTVRVIRDGTDPCPTPVTLAPTPAPPAPTPAPCQSPSCRTPIKVNINFQNMLNGVQGP